MSDLHNLFKPVTAAEKPSKGNIIQSINNVFVQPRQAIPESEKDIAWARWNIDWLEWQGLKHIRRKAKRLLKNYKLAKGIIDKSDYIIEEDNEYADLLEGLSEGKDIAAIELKFYPIIPVVINVLIHEFSKRNTRLIFKAVDDISYSDYLEEKNNLVLHLLKFEARFNVLRSLLENGLSIDDPAVKQEAEKMLSDDSIMSLPDIEDYMKSKYKHHIEEWCNHLLKVDEQRFDFYQLEIRAFYDSLVTDSEFWHFRMYDNDYDVELLNPILTFYQKSPKNRFVSDSQWAGFIDMMHVSDVLDKYGKYLTPEQVEMLEKRFPVRAGLYLQTGVNNDGSFWDFGRTAQENQQYPGLDYRRLVSTYDKWGFTMTDIVNMVLWESEDYADNGSSFFLRVTTVYWKTLKKVGLLTKKDKVTGKVTVMQVDENFKVTEKPEYDLSVKKEKSAETLICGEHVDWFWINEVWGGIKIGPNTPIGVPQENTFNDVIYIGINSNKPGPVPCQFRDSENFSVKIPIEGAVFTDRNTRSISLTDILKPYQLMYNIVYNQINDILIDELGSVLVLEQNVLPKHSLGEDWGKNNFAKAYEAMKTFNILPLDTSIANSEYRINMSPANVINLEQSQRLVTRMKLAEWIKVQAMEAIGITPARLGQPSVNTAAELVNSVEQSYSQTEIYFIQHCDFLMPRVHQMRTTLALHYLLNNSSSRLRYTTSKGERIIFNLEGEDVLRKVDVYSVTRADYRHILENIKRMLLSNPNTGAGLTDLVKIMEADSLAQLHSILVDLEKKFDKIKQYELEKERQAFELKKELMQLQQQWESSEKQKDRETAIQKEIINSARYSSAKDLNQNQIADYFEYLKMLLKKNNMDMIAESKQKNLDLKEKSMNDSLSLQREKLNLEREKMEKQLEIAKENKNQYDIEAMRILNQMQNNQQNQ